jgi:hypothetical protein
VTIANGDDDNKWVSTKIGLWQKVVPQLTKLFLHNFSSPDFVASIYDASLAVSMDCCKSMAIRRGMCDVSRDAWGTRVTYGYAQWFSITYGMYAYYSTRVGLMKDDYAQYSSMGHGQA